MTVYVTINQIEEDDTYPTLKTRNDGLGCVAYFHSADQCTIMVAGDTNYKPGDLIKLADGVRYCFIPFQGHLILSNALNEIMETPDD